MKKSNVGKAINKLGASLSIIAGAATILPLSVGVAHARERATLVSQNIAEAERGQASQLALTQSSETLLSLIIATSRVEQLAGDLIAIHPDVARKYTLIRNAYLGSVPTSGVTITATFLGVESSKKVEFVLAPLTAVLRAAQLMARASINGIERFSLMTGLDRVIRASLESSGESLELTYKQLIKPVVELLVNKHTAISSGSSSATATAAGSIYFLMNDSREAMTSDMVRSILGQDRIIRDRVDQAVQGLSEIYALSAEQQNKLKIVIYDEILRQAVANNFALESSAYQLDLVRLMADKKIIDTSTAKAVFEIREKVQKLTESVVVDANMREVTLQNIDLALQLAALLESQLANPKLQNKTVRAEVERMLGSVHGRLTVVGFNLKKSDVMTSR